MKPPNIGAKLLKRFNNAADEPLTIRRHLGWADEDGTPRDLGYTDAVLAGPFYFGPVPANSTLQLDSIGDIPGDARFLWALTPLSRGVAGDPPTARAPDQIVRGNTGEVYRVERVLDTASSQSGLYGAWLVLAD